MDSWDGQSLQGQWNVTRKIDGVNVVYKAGVPLSRKGKPLYNLPNMPDGVYEVYLGSFKSTISAVRTKDRGKTIAKENLYNIGIEPDQRLLITSVLNPNATFVRSLLTTVLQEGYEGLVLRQGKKQLKVKPVDTYDVEITGIVEGTGKHTGRLGALITPKGRIGTGFTDAEREELFTEDVIGETVEVKCMQLTEAGMFRHPVFVNMRYDK